MMPTSKYTQLRHPLLDRWVKLSTRTGRIIAIKKSSGPWKGVPQRANGR